MNAYGRVGVRADCRAELIRHAKCSRRIVRVAVSESKLLWKRAGFTRYVPVALVSVTATVRYIDFACH